MLWGTSRTPLIATIQMLQTSLSPTPSCFCFQIKQKVLPGRDCKSHIFFYFMLLVVMSCYGCFVAQATGKKDGIYSTVNFGSHCQGQDKTMNAIFSFFNYKLCSNFWNWYSQQNHWWIWNLLVWLKHLTMHQTSCCRPHIWFGMKMPMSFCVQCKMIPR